MTGFGIFTGKAMFASRLKAKTIVDHDSTTFIRLEGRDEDSK